MTAVKKLRVGEVFQSARYRDAGIRILNEIDRADWLWHPQVPIEEPAFLLFENTFNIGATEAATEFSVSADQYYELYLDGERISSGPDMGNVDHWFFSSYALTLSPGEHTLQARVWWLGNHAPESTMTWRGGFAFSASGALSEKLTTGFGDWRVRQMQGNTLKFKTIVNTYHVIGSVQQQDSRSAPGGWEKPAVVRAGLKRDCDTGCCVAGGWRLYPSVLPDQVDETCVPGRFRACVETETDGKYAYTAQDQSQAELACWNDLLSGRVGEVIIPPQTSRCLLWDLENYYCGFTEGIFDGGEGAHIEWRWAESLFRLADSEKLHKDDRSAITGKYFVGFGHEYIANGQPAQLFRPYWWGAGRYCRLQITTGEQPLTVRALRINETRYPLRDEGAFQPQGADFSGIRKIALRVMQMCSHTTYMDCPYYEQMMYVGDTRMEVLTNYILTRDAALPRRAIELYDYSRSHWGVACERYPARVWQNSLTFAMIWTWMAHDYCFWRGDMGWVKERLAGVRSNLDVIGQYVNPEGLLEKLPGWSFMDWIWLKTWHTGEAPGSQDGVSALINLMYLLSLQKVAELEDLTGSPLRAQDWRERAEALKPVLLAKFWDEERGLLADELTHQCFSEHAQCLAVLAGLFSPQQQERAMDTMLAASDLAKTTIYFRFYYFDALFRTGRAQKVLDSFADWRELLDHGLMTTIESPEPSRSDCHAWGAHPLFFMVNGLFGLRPTAPGMQKMRIAPQPGNLPGFSGRVPHPQGEIVFDLKFSGAHCTGSVSLPEGVEGVWAWQGQEKPFRGSLALC